jgi:uncharacterized protein (TIGR03792 family)
MAMVIEWLKFRVNPQKREEFIRKDAEIWTSVLASYPGFLGKEVWIDPHTLEEVVCIIRWETKEQWKAIPQTALDATEQQFARGMGKVYELVETGEYQVCKFPRC